MICEETIYRFCDGDISKIENYDKAINDDTQTWDCHHRLEELGFTKDELKYLGLYYKIPADELIFLTRQEHIDIHKKGRERPEEVKEKISRTSKERGSKAGPNNPCWGKFGPDHPKYGKSNSLESIARSAEKQRGVPKPQFKWLTSDGDIKIMDNRNASRWHPDWQLLGPIE